MPVKTINDIRSKSVTIRSAGTTVHVGSAGIVTGEYVGNVDEGAITEGLIPTASIHDNTYRIDGRLADFLFGICTTGDRDVIRVGGTGHISVDLSAVYLTGDDSTVDNLGEISAGYSGTGVYLADGQRSHLSNDGLISGNNGIVANQDGAVIVNGKHGIVTGATAAVAENSLDSCQIALDNHGLIIGSGGVAVQLNLGVLNLTNDGTIKGDVDFGSGGGTVDNRGGTIRGAINGGSGDDTLIVDDAKYRLVELADSGYDTVKTTVSYTLDTNVERLVLIGKADIDGNGTAGGDALRGNNGDNVLNGLDGADDLSGGKGNDKLFGGAGEDAFIFATGFGRDTIEDFTPGEDRIDLHGWTAVQSFPKVLAHAADHGDTVWITAGHDTLVIDHLHKADLVRGDFLWEVQ